MEVNASPPGDHTQDVAKTQRVGEIQHNDIPEFVPRDIWSELSNVPQDVPFPCGAVNPGAKPTERRSQYGDKDKWGPQPELEAATGRSWPRPPTAREPSA